MDDNLGDFSLSNSRFSASELTWEIVEILVANITSL